MKLTYRKKIKSPCIVLNPKAIAKMVIRTAVAVNKYSQDDHHNRCIELILNSETQ